MIFWNLTHLFLFLSIFSIVSAKKEVAFSFKWIRIDNNKTILFLNIDCFELIQSNLNFFLFLTVAPFLASFDVLSDYRNKSHIMLIALSEGIRDHI